ncbi:LysR family transcriptional regulator [Leptobacterium sp. I13]|uniref:LysR family transcriptional regulator n=1 Tax=Leptobacterium meishanense TaxID=3128904 RepID=UPI0030ECBD93
MNLQQLRNALVLAKKLHFTKAAQEVNIVQPALSRQIRQLEEEVGVKLFVRDKRNVELTAPGSYFIKEIEKILAQIERINEKAKEIAEQGSGEIRIGFTHSVMQTILPEVIKKIRMSKPGVKTILMEINNRGQFQALQSKKLDIGFATNPLIPPELKGERLSLDNFVVLVPMAHPISQENYSDFSAFANEEFIFPPMADGSNYLRIIESICLDAGFVPKVTHITSSASTSFKLVEAGMGICIEPKTSLHKQELPVKVIELKNIPQKAELTMIWNEDFEVEYPELLAQLKDSKSYKSLSSLKI